MSNCSRALSTLAAAIGVLTCASAVTAFTTPDQETHHRGMVFVPPAGWMSGPVDGRLQLTSPDTPPDQAVVVVIHGAEPLAGRSVEDWFRTKMAADLGARVKTLQASPPEVRQSGATQIASSGRTVEDAAGVVRLQIYQGVSDGQQAGLAMASATSEAAMRRHLTVVQAVFRSARIAAAPAARAGAPPASPAGRGAVKIMAADIAGSWSHSTSSYADYVRGSSGSYAGSSTIAYGQGYDFAADGTFKYQFTGMINSRYVKEADAGTWALQGSSLVIRSLERNSTKTYQIVGYQTAPDGAVFMTLLAGSYPPTEGNIGLYAEKFVRKPR